MAEDKDREGFAKRWSERKQAAKRAGARSDAATDDADSEEKSTEITTQTPDHDPPAALPPVDELTAESDYTPFLAREVPVELRRTALRKLWRSDPTLANLDGLNDYDEDFASLGVGKLVRTAYRIGKGLVAPASAREARAGEESGEDAADAPEAAESPPGPAETET